MIFKFLLQHYPPLLSTFSLGCPYYFFGTFSWAIARLSVYACPYHIKTFVSEVSIRTLINEFSFWIRWPFRPPGFRNASFACMFIKLGPFTLSERSTFKECCSTRRRVSVIVWIKIESLNYTPNKHLIYTSIQRQNVVELTSRPIKMNCEPPRMKIHILKI